jgi:hypothetical protein
LSMTVSFMGNEATSETASSGNGTTNMMTHYDSMGKVSQPSSVLQSLSPDEPDDPEERMNRLQKLFDRLSPDEEYIDATRCHEIMVLVLGCKRAPDLAETQQTLTELCRHVRRVSREPGDSSNGGASTWPSKFYDDVIGFTTFVYLMNGSALD